MERHEILEAMSELKLYGMRASFAKAASSTPSATQSLSADPSPIHNAHLAMSLIFQGQHRLILRRRPC